MTLDNFYISCPISVPDSTLYEVSEVLVKKAFQNGKSNLSIYHWERGSHYGDYERERITTCDAMVVILPDNLFSSEIMDIPKGTRDEMRLAKNHNIPIYLAYKRKDGNIYIYDTNFHSTIFKGIPDTADKLFQKCKEVSTKIEEKFVSQDISSSYNKTILLLI